MPIREASLFTSNDEASRQCRRLIRGLRSHVDQRRRSDKKLGATIVDDVRGLFLFQVCANRCKDNTRAHTTEHDFHKLATIFHHHRNMLPLFNALGTKQLCDFIGSRIKLSEGHDLSACAHDERGLLRIGNRMICNSRHVRLILFMYCATRVL